VLSVSEEMFEPETPSKTPKNRFRNANRTFCSSVDQLAVVLEESCRLDAEKSSVKGSPAVAA